MSENRDPREPQVRTAELLARVSDLLDLSEMAHNLACKTRTVEDKLLGQPGDDQNTPLVTEAGANINSDLELYINSIRTSLQRLSDSLHRLSIDVGV